MRRRNGLQRRFRRRLADDRGRALTSAGAAARLAGTLAAATAAGALAAQARIPLPWMIGPLACTALAGVCAMPVAASSRLRNVGQWLIGIALGLYFTPAVAARVAALGPAVLLGIGWALLAGYGFHRWLAWTNPGADRATTWFSAAIGGASEMAVMGERAGARVDRVAAAHSLRVLIVVVSIPFAMQWSGAHGTDPAAQALHAVQPGGLALLAALTLAGALLLQRLAVPNPFVFGGLLVTGALTLTGIELSALPRWATNAGQLFIGVALGARFTPEFVRTAPRWLSSVALGTIGLLLSSAAFAALLATAFDLPLATAVLATSPGGIAEMAITAQVLQLGVPTVTAFHVLRYVAVLALTGPLFRCRGASST